MNLNMISLGRSVLIVLACVPLAVMAEPATELQGVVVTATRTAQTQDATLAPVTVVTREDIERLQPASLRDLLRGLPGVSVSNNGGPGKATSIRLRGTEADHVVVLIDGMRVGSVTSGGAAFQDFPVAQIERIEIVRGPFSSLYGSEAIGGVIQIFTRRPEGAFSPHFSVGASSWNGRHASAGMGGRGDRGWYAINLSHDRTDGINAHRCADPTGATCYGFNPDKDGYRNTTLTAQAAYDFSKAWSGQLHLMRVDGHNEYDGSVSDASDIEQRVLNGSLRYRPAEAFTLTLDLGRSDDISDNFLGSAAAGYYYSHRHLASLQADIGVGSGLLSLGYDWERDSIDSDPSYTVDERINRALFGQWLQAFGNQSLQLNLRRDDNDQFGGETTGSILWGLDLSESLRLTASYGTAYKAPSFNELYFPGYGNPNLGPETSDSIEFGLRGRHDWGGWSLNAYQTDVDNMIAYDSSLVDDAHPFGQPNNIGQARLLGVEAAVNGTLADWTWQFSSNWMDSSNEGAGPSKGNWLPRRARLSGRIDLDRDFGAFDFGTSLYAAGKRYDDIANQVRLGGYALVDLRVAWAMTPDWHLRLSLNNAFDRTYETAYEYNQPGRNFRLTLSYQPAP